MALNASGPISLAGATTGQSIAVELALGTTTQISLNDTAVRTLAGVASGPITMPTDFWGKSNGIPFGAVEYRWVANNPPTNTIYSFVVPTGATTICAVCIGGGGGAKTTTGTGGALSYSNGIPVTAGETLTVTAGRGGYHTVALGLLNGGVSSIARGGTILISAAGGLTGTGTSANYPLLGGQASAGVGQVKYSGGGAPNGYVGGASAAGYSADGVQGVLNANGQNGQGGSGGAGGGSAGNLAGPGGGTGSVVAGANGAGGVYVGTANGTRGGTGSGGSGGSGADGFGFGWGAGGHGDSTATRFGGGGVVRIIYGGVDKTYPNNSAP